MLEKKKPYNQRTDLEKIKSNWKKTKGLFKREEWSTVVMRAVTTVELAANYVIRKELQERRNIEEEFVNHLLIWANGIRGKFDKLIVPLFINTDLAKELKTLNKKAQEINRERNSVAHSGQFKEKLIATKVMDVSKEITEALISIYENDFQLKG